MLVCKVIGVVSVESISRNLSIVCHTCCIVDTEGHSAVLTVYNLTAGSGLVVGDTVVIPEPWCERVDIKFMLSESFKGATTLLETLRAEISQSDDGTGLYTERNINDSYGFRFDSVRVENPTVLVVNGKKWTKDKVSSAFFIPKMVAD